MADNDPIRIGRTNNIETNNLAGTGAVLARAANSPRTDPVFTVRTPVGGDGIHGEASANNNGVVGSSNSGFGVFGFSNSSVGAGGNSTSGLGVVGNSRSNTGVRGNSNSFVGVIGDSTNSIGVLGNSSSFVGVRGSGGGGGAGVVGDSISSTGVQGNSTNGFGVSGQSTSLVGAAGFSNSSTGVQGFSTSGSGVAGFSTSSFGVSGQSTSGVGAGGFSDSNFGVSGSSTSGVGAAGFSTSSFGVSGSSTSGVGAGGFSDSDFGVSGSSTSFVGAAGFSTTGTGVFGQGGFRAGWFEGNVHVNGNLSVTGNKPFKMDHPLDPQNRYLLHNAVESSERKNVYDGVAHLDEDGEALVGLPEWFEALNGDLRYQLTAVGGPAPGLHVAEEISENRFKIAGGEGGLKVCWQVTGSRKDPWAAANPFVVEEDKPQEERGRYLQPDLYGAPEEQSVLRARMGVMRGPQPLQIPHPPPVVFEPPRAPAMPPGVDFVPTTHEEGYRQQIDELRRLVEEQRREMEELRRRVGPQEEAPPEST